MLEITFMFIKYMCRFEMKIAEEFLRILFVLKITLLFNFTIEGY
jgi:hypothetical protein